MAPTPRQTEFDPHATHAVRRRVDFFPYVLILPICLGVLLVDVYPFLSAFIISLQNRVQGQPVDSFVGLRNYRTILADPRFGQALLITAKWTAGSVAGQLLLGTGLALLVHGLRRGQRLLTALLLLPWATPLVVAALLWRWILHADFGIFNSIIDPRWLGLPAGHDWLGDPRTVLPAVIAVQIWKYYGFVMIIVLARLKSLPAELPEAAVLDGCGRWALFRHVTAPQLADVLVVAVLLMLIWTFNTFDTVYLLAGDSAAAGVLALEVWRRFFGSFNYGLAAATAVLMFLILFAATLAYARRCRL